MSKDANKSAHEAPTRTGLNRRQILRGGLTLGSAALFLGGCEGEESGDSDAAKTAENAACEVPVDADYDGGQLLYRRSRTRPSPPSLPTDARPWLAAG